MRKVFLALTILSLSFFSYGQSIPRLLKIADKFYQSARYEDAIETYDKIIGIDKNNHFARFRLALCYDRTGDTEDSKETYLELSNIPGHEYRARALYSYANYIKQENRFLEADSLYVALISMPDAEPYLIELSRKQSEGCQLALRQDKVDRGYTILEMEGINSKSHDFGATVNPSNGHLVLATTRNLPGVQYPGVQKEGFLPDLATYENRGENRWRLSFSDQKFGDLNTKWAEGSGSFTSDGNTFYFRTCLDENGSDCGIVVSYLEDGKWTKPILLNDYINEEGSINKQPAISVTGDTLFFISDRTGGVGGSDIWMSLRGLEKDAWTPAINMGAVINTPENEITPYFSSAFQCLLFASEGHVGYGGFDLYAAKGESFFEPQIYNLGNPFNSTWDDVYFNISDSVGYVATNRQDHKLLNLFQFSVSNEKLFLSLLISGESLIDSRLASKFKDAQSLDLVTFRVEDYAGYDLFEPIRPSKPKPKILQSEVDTLGVVGEIAYEKIYYNFGLSTLRPEARASLESLVAQIDDKGISSIDILAFTDNIGPAQSNLRLSESRGVSAKDYLVSLGIDSSIINVFPRGEIPSEGASDHWFKRILRRRIEVIVKTSEPINLTTADSYIVREEITLERLASIIDVNLNEMKQWNGEQNGKLTKGSTIRIQKGKLKETPIQLLVGEEDVSKFIK